MRHDHEIQEILKHEDDVRFIEVQRIQWLGHLEWIDEQCILKKIVKAMLHNQKRCYPSTRCLHDLLQDLKSTGVGGYMEVAQDICWRRVIVEVKTHGLYVQEKEEHLSKTVENAQSTGNNHSDIELNTVSVNLIMTYNLKILS